jgi:chromosome segregation ATPase
MLPNRLRIIFMSIGVAVFLASLGFYAQVMVRNDKKQYEKQFKKQIVDLKSLQGQELGRMKEEISRLRQLQQELSKADFVTNETLNKERVAAQRLQKKLEILIAQNKSLCRKIDLALADKQALSQAKDELEKKLDELKVQNSGFEKEIEVLRRNFDVALQVKSRLEQVRESMDGLIIKKGKENILQLQLDALASELQTINSYLADIRDDKPVQKQQISSAPELEKKEASNPDLEIKYLDQVNDLKARINILTNENTVLKEKYLMAQDVAVEHKKILDAGSQKIFALQTRLIEAENALSQMQARYGDLERNAASLRERYVANELEKEGLKIKLNQLTAELNEVRSKFLALLGKISDIFKSPEGEILSSQRKDITSIIGVELYPNATDKRQ